MGVGDGGQTMGVRRWGSDDGGQTMGVRRWGSVHFPTVIGV